MEYSEYFPPISCYSLCGNNNKVHSFAPTRRYICRESCRENGLKRVRSVWWLKQKRVYSNRRSEKTYMTIPSVLYAVCWIRSVLVTFVILLILNSPSEFKFTFNSDIYAKRNQNGIRKRKYKLNFTKAEKNSKFNDSIDGKCKCKQN